jgi:hypothetical protein
VSDRYDGKPFLRLLDSYVLDAIGYLDATTAAWLTEAEPHFRHEFGHTGSWREIVEQRMQFPERMRDAIRELWVKGNLRFDDPDGQRPHPVNFAHMFVDRSFPH